MTTKVVETLDGGLAAVDTMIAMEATRDMAVAEEEMEDTLKVGTRARTVAALAVAASAVETVAATLSSQEEEEAMTTPASLVEATLIGEIAAANKTKVFQVVWAEATEVATLQALLSKIATTPTQVVAATTPLQWAEDKDRAISKSLLP